jgi:hypothetical protein
MLNFFHYHLKVIPHDIYFFFFFFFFALRLGADHNIDWAC